MILPLTTMAQALTVGTATFLLGLILGAPLIAALRRHRIGKQIRMDGPASHQGKTGTPTMGGIMIFISVMIMTTLFNVLGRLSILLPLATIVSCGIIGGVDDILSLVGNGKGGMRARLKMAMVLAVATVAALVLYYLLDPPTFIPFIGRVRISPLIYVPMAIFAIVATSHAVNLTDGLDSLAGYTTATAFVVYGIIAYLQGQWYLVTFCFTVTGAILAFLWYNANPAQVFMGDTGSLALGSTLAVVAFMTGHWLLLPIIGFVFVAEALSVMLQVGFFKLSKGKRLFKMAPLHHHFELVGWSEVQVAQRFWLIGILAGMLGVALALS